MLKILKPSQNKITGGYNSKHKGYDHSGKGDTNYYSSIYGKVVQAKNSETRNWVAFTSNDPYKEKRSGSLLTEDYGNYIKIKGEVDGQVVYQLGAHFEPGSVLPVGTEVKAGQVVAKIGNTGNSTGAHSHTEYRNDKNENFEVEFVDTPITPPNEVEKLPKDNVIRDFYSVVKEVFSDDEIKRWMQENKNLREIFTSVMEGDGEVKKLWLNKWNVNDSVDKGKVIEKMTETQNEIKDILRPVGYQPGSTTEEMLGLLSGVVTELQELRKATRPETIYKHEGKDFEKVLSIGNITVILEKGGGKNG